MNKQNKKIEDKLEKEILTKVVQETKEGKIQWKWGELERSSRFGSSKFGFTAEWEGKKLEFSRETDWESILVFSSDYSLKISSGKTSTVIYGGTISLSFIPIYLSWRTIRPLQKLHSFLERQKELDCRKNEETKRLESIGVLEKSL